jgi:hypothetical protein
VVIFSIVAIPAQHLCEEPFEHPPRCLLGVTTAACEARFMFAAIKPENLFGLRPGLPSFMVHGFLDFVTRFIAQTRTNS